MIMASMLATKVGYTERSRFLTLILIVSASVLLISNNVRADGEEDDTPTDLEKILFRPRLGHFADTNGFLDVFLAYFNNVIMPSDKAAEHLPQEHWRRYRPSGELCLNFLHGFKEAKNYQLNKPFDIIPLDACLDWLFDQSQEKQMDLDQMNKVAQSEASKLAKDKRLREIFESTHFRDDSVPLDLKKNLFDYLVKLLNINRDNPHNGCHGLWLEGYTDFIEDIYLDDCEDDDDCTYFGWAEAAQDSYLKLVVDSTKTASKNCYKVMQKQVKGLMNRAYMEEPKITRHTFISSKAAKQSDSMKWGREMMRILQLVTDTDPENAVDLGNVVSDLNKLKQRDEEITERFTTALARYAIQNVNLKDSANDPLGRTRYGKAMVKLCRPYINERSFLASTGGVNLWEDPTLEKKPFEFYSIVNGLVRLTNHESFYGVSKPKFEEDVIKNGWESLYLATFACQLIASTYAELNYDTNEAAFDVSFRENEEQVLIDDWPIEVLMNKHQNEANIDDSSSAKGKKSSSGSGSATRGLSFGLKWGSGKLKNGNAGNQSAQKSDHEEGSSESQSGQESAKKSGDSSGSRLFGFGIRMNKNLKPKPEQTPPANELEVEPEQQTEQAAARRPGGFGISLNKNRNGNMRSQEQTTPVEEPQRQESAPAPVYQPAPTFEQTHVNPQPMNTFLQSTPPATERKIPSLQTIKMFRELHGRYPSDLPADIHEIYPELPKNLGGEYEKKAIKPPTAPVYNHKTIDATPQPKEDARPAKLSDLRFKKNNPDLSTYANRRSKFSDSDDSKPAAKANKWANVDTFF